MGDEVSRDSGEVAATNMTFPPDQSFSTGIGEDDVLLGRGTGPNEFSGNIRYRRLVRQAITSVHPRDLASNKAALARKVVDDVAERGGRFVRKLSKAEVAALYDCLNPKSGAKTELATHVSQKSTIYIDVARDVAIEKTKQSFRHQTRVKQKLPPKNADFQPSKRPTAARPSVVGSTAGRASIGTTTTATDPISSSLVDSLAAAVPASPRSLIRGLLGARTPGLASSSSTNAPTLPGTPAAIQALLMRYISSLPQPSQTQTSSFAMSGFQPTASQNNHVQPLHQLPLLNQVAVALAASTLPPSITHNTSSSSMLLPQAALALQLARQQQQQYVIATLLASSQLPATNNNTNDLVASLFASSAHRPLPSLPLNEQQQQQHTGRHHQQPIDTSRLMALLQGGLTHHPISSSQPSPAVAHASSTTTTDSQTGTNNDNSDDYKNEHETKISSSTKNKAKGNPS